MGDRRVSPRPSGLDDVLQVEFTGVAHSWFTGYRGDMAFSALIVGGGSSEYAVRMLRGMLDELPPGYLA